jgi:lysophospholipase L1-like esterase
MFSETETSAGNIGASRRGRRRRMLAIRSASEVPSAIDSNVDLTSPSDSDEASAASAESTTPREAATAAPTSFASDRDRIQELLDGVDPRTWVFTGDNLGFEVQQARRGWIEHFSDFVHEKLQRKHDIILNSSLANSTIDHLLKDVEWRILRFQPDVVLVMPSAAECAERGADDEFRATLQQLTDRLHEEGCSVVLNTPPCPANASQSVTRTMKTAASRIRAVATQTGAVLADHFSNWQATTQRDGTNANLHEESGQQPSARGHRELARRLLKSLNIRSS